MTDDWGTFVELESCYNKNIDDEHILNFGTTVWLLNNLQLDLAYGIGLTESTIENQFTIGASVRLFK